MSVRAGSAAALAITPRDPFDADHWRDTSPEGRGRMILDLAQRSDFDGRWVNDVQRQLDDSTCYEVNEGFPCYVLTLAGTRHRLTMHVTPDSSGWRGRVESAVLKR